MQVIMSCNRAGTASSLHVDYSSSRRTPAEHFKTSSWSPQHVRSPHTAHPAESGHHPFPALEIVGAVIGQTPALR
jgi:hypothetical protein